MNNRIKQPTKHRHTQALPEQDPPPESINFTYKPTALCSIENNKVVYHKFTYNNQPLKAFGEELAKEHGKIIHTIVYYIIDYNAGYDEAEDEECYLIHEHNPPQLFKNTDIMILKVTPTNNSFYHDKIWQRGKAMHKCVYKKNRCTKCSKKNRTDRNYYRKEEKKKKSIMYLENTQSNKSYRRRQHTLPHLDQYNEFFMPNFNSHKEKPYFSRYTYLIHSNYKRN